MVCFQLVILVIIPIRSIGRGDGHTICIVNGSIVMSQSHGVRYREDQHRLSVEND